MMSTLPTNAFSTMGLECSAMVTMLRRLPSSLCQITCFTPSAPGSSQENLASSPSATLTSSLFSISTEQTVKTKHGYDDS